MGRLYRWGKWKSVEEVSGEGEGEMWMRESEELKGKR